MAGAKLLAKALSRVIAQEAEAKAAKSIRAYHGSPYKFDKFDASKIGTGEGAQVYGHGLYFAEREGIARSYRDKLQSTSRAHNTFDGRKITPAYLKELQASPEIHVADFFNFQLPPALQGTSKAAKPWIMERIATNQDKALSYTKRAKELREGLAGRPDGSRIIASTYEPEYFEQMAKVHEGNIAPWRDLHNRFAHVPAEKKGAMYEVDIQADPDSLLDWDAPLRQQPPALLDYIDQHPQAAKLTSNDIVRGELQEPSGSDIYRRLGQADYLADKITRPAIGGSRALQEAGVPGIKYYDAGSRATRSGTRNFVVFDPEMVKILRRYAMPVAAGAGVGSAALMGMPQQQQPQY